MEKRKGFKCPVADIHTKIIVGYAKDTTNSLDFVIYEHYGTWYLYILTKE